jgi:hypothetical protein
MELRKAKQILRAALATATDEKLAEMLAWAQDGMMIYRSACQCFVGSLGSKHVHKNSACEDESVILQHRAESLSSKQFAVSIIAPVHYSRAVSEFPRADSAYAHLYRLSDVLDGSNEDVMRQRRIVPIIKAQIRLRSRRTILQAQSADSSGRVLSRPEEIGALV